MFDNTLTVLRGAVSTAFSRKPSTNPTVGVFKNPLGTEIIEIRQKSTRNRTRSEFVITTRKVATDPLTAVLSEVSMSVGFYVDQPKVGFTSVEALGSFNSTKDFLNAANNFVMLHSGDA